MMDPLKITVDEFLELAHNQRVPSTTTNTSAACTARAKSMVILNSNVLSLDEKQGTFALSFSSQILIVN